MSRRFQIPLGFVLQSGEKFDPNAFLAYETYGTLNAGRTNAILWPTCYFQRTSQQKRHIGDASSREATFRFDSSKYFIITVNMFGNGLSFSPTTSGAKWPKRGVTYNDNVRAQQLLLKQVFDIDRLALIYGFSMGAMFALEYCVHFPQQVTAAVAVCGSARCNPANHFFLQSLQMELKGHAKAEIDSETQRLIGFSGTARPQPALKRFAAIYSDWIFDAPRLQNEISDTSMGGSPNELRPSFAKSLHGGGRVFPEKLHGAPSVDEFSKGWEGSWCGEETGWDALEFYEVSDTWLRGDVSRNPAHNGDLKSALNSIEALVYFLPGSTDQYFRAEEIAEEAKHIPNCIFKPLESPMGHLAESAQDMQEIINDAIQVCLRKSAM